MPQDAPTSSRILIIGAGPIVIGQACEFDYSGAQACKALREEGYRVILVNSNPATIMTDPEMADVTYIEPHHRRQIVEQIIAQGAPGRAAADHGRADRAQLRAATCASRRARASTACELIGANADGDRQGRGPRASSSDAMARDRPDGAGARGMAHTMDEALAGRRPSIGFPPIIRPAFTLGGTGGGIAYNREEFERDRRSAASTRRPITEVLIEEIAARLEGVRDGGRARPRGQLHHRLLDREPRPDGRAHRRLDHRRPGADAHRQGIPACMRDASIAMLREIGVDTGGSNVQFAVNPQTAGMVVIEMNPRVSRSSALASKATGFPIAKIAAKLAVGYTLDELAQRHHRRRTPASLRADDRLRRHQDPALRLREVPAAPTDASTTQMKSVGEVMAIGRTFQEALQKALRGLEIGVDGLDAEDRRPR
jgi:carbamoyl-phosphate synthase large subunit